MTRIAHLAVTLTLLGLAGCSGSTSTAPDDAPDPTSKSTPKALLGLDGFASCDAFRSYYAEALATELFTGAYLGGCFGCEDDVFLATGAESGASDDATNAPAAPEAAGDERVVTDTNTQEAGVDEPDLIETTADGNTLYILRRQTRELLVVDSTDPAAPTIITRVALNTARSPSGLLLDRANDRLVVLLESGFYYIAAPAVADAAFAPPPDFAEGTELRFYDVSDRSTPALIDTLVADGHLVNARRIDDRVHLITQFGLPFPPALQDEAFFELAYQDYPAARRAGDDEEVARLEQQIRNRIDAAVAQMSPADLLPEFTDTAGSRTLACEAIQRPDVTTRLGLLVISSIDSDGGNAAHVGSINNAWQVYASAESLYLVQPSNGWWFDRAQRQQSAIYRFDIGSGSAIPGGVGLVDGWIDDRFSLSEFDGHLRVASTEGVFERNGAPFRLENHMTVLDTATMEVSGIERNFLSDKPRDRIQSARFVGERGFVVTFERVDPLVTFDLSDPNAPRKVAELDDIPGFATYIHPLGDDHLLTIGRAGGADGTGVGNSYQVQIFDVSDLATPTEVVTAQPALADNEYAYSLAEFEPLAFTFLPDAASPTSGLLSIPAQISSPYSGRSLSGFVAYRVDAGSAVIDEYARVDHKDVPADGGDRCPPQRDEVPPDGCAGFAPVRYNEPLRSAVIRDGDATTLLTVSSARLKATDASDAAPVDRATVDFD